MTEPFGVESTGYVAIRLLQYAALLMLIGAVVFTSAVLRRAAHALPPHTLVAAQARAARMGGIAATALAATAVLRLVAQSYAMGMESLIAERAMLVTMLRATDWGHAWILEAVGIVISLFAFTDAQRHGRRGWLVAAGASGMLALSMAMSGHAAAVPHSRWLAMLADTLHVLGAAGWLGSLLLLAIAGVPVALRDEDERRWQTVAALVAAFSPVALVCAAVVACSGVFAATLHLTTLASLWQSRYGQLLLVKLGLLSVTALIGLYNWKRVTPTLTAGPQSVLTLRRAATAELAVGFAVLVVTAILVATPTPMDL